MNRAQLRVTGTLRGQSHGCEPSVILLSWTPGLTGEAWAAITDRLSFSCSITIPRFTAGTFHSSSTN